MASVTACITARRARRSLASSASSSATSKRSRRASSQPRFARNASVATVSASRDRAARKPTSRERSPHRRTRRRTRPRSPASPTNSARSSPLKAPNRPAAGQRDPRARPPTDVPTYRVPAAVRAMPSKVERAGLEPATPSLQRRNDALLGGHLTQQPASKWRSGITQHHVTRHGQLTGS